MPLRASARDYSVPAANNDSSHNGLELRELRSVPEEALSPKPGTLSLEQAAAIGVPFLTAWFALVHAAQLEAGETILIVGAGGAVGQAATQIAHWRKARVLGAEVLTF
jgi:NADPH:quinone reductase